MFSPITNIDAIFNPEFDLKTSLQSNLLIFEDFLDIQYTYISETSGLLFLIVKFDEKESKKYYIFKSKMQVDQLIVNISKETDQN